MIRHPAVFLGAVSVAGIVGGLSFLWVSVTDYVDTTYPVSSSSGNVVLLRNGELAAYPPYESGLELTVIGLGVALAVATVFIAAIVWRPRA